MDNKLEKEVDFVVRQTMLAASIKMSKDFYIYEKQYNSIIDSLFGTSYSILFLGLVKLKNNKPIILTTNEEEIELIRKKYNVAYKILEEIYVNLKEEDTKRVIKEKCFIKNI